MRGRVVIITMISMALAMVGMTQVQATSGPVRQAARSAIKLTPAQTETTAMVATPVVRLPAPQIRDIFAALPSQRPLLTAPAVTPSTASGTTLHLAALVNEVTFQDETEYSATEKAHIDELLATSFAKFPTPFVSQLKHLTLKKSRTGSRGLAGATVMILRTFGVTDQELVAVSIHELGHVVDMGVIKGNAAAGASAFLDGADAVWKDDASLKFYSISWSNEHERLSANPADFVSGYAMSDPFEDFAESFAMYVLHGERFRKLTVVNTAMELKYNYLRDTVFGGREFGGIDAIPASTLTSVRPWDVTLEPYNWSAFSQAQFAL